MTALLTDNLPLLAGAPNGIKKLRELILELAVRGKLVEQDASDEPASELLKRIAQEKNHLATEGQLKKQKPLVGISEEEKPYDLPGSWAWVRLPEIYYPVSVSGNKLMSSQINEEGTFPVVDQGKRFVAGYTDDESLLIRLPGPVVVFGDHTTERKYVDFDFVAGADGVKILRPVLLDEKFFWWHLVGLKLEGRGYARHFKVLNDALFALPPRSEQSRIVAKVDELMALCDRLEAQQVDAASAHAQLVQALLGSLIQASDASEFAANWQRLAEHFHSLFSTEPSIDALKQTLLQLAVMGKLVPQDPSDEPASELCKSIEAEKQRLVAAKKIKDTPKLEPVSADEELFSVPPSWAWIRMGDICRPISSGSTPSSELFQYDEGIPFLKVYNIRNQEVDFDYKKQFVSAKHHAEKMRRSTLVPGDVVMNIVGPPLGKVAIIPDAFPEWNCNQAIVFFGLIAPVSSQYIYTFLKEGSFLKNIALIGTAGQDNISVTKSKNIAVPLPPLAEQHRIVAKVDQLMALCDQLKTQLSQARQLNQQLASTLVEQAVA
jgi:type I restriction enzyme S subunit